MSRHVWAALLALGLVSGMLVPSGWGFGAATAWADDDGDSDDSDDDDDGDDAPDGGERGERGERQSARAAPSPAPRPEFAPELLAVDLSEADLLTLLGEGFVLFERIDLPAAQSVVWRLGAPAGVAIEAARDRVRALPGLAPADVNHYYRPGQSALPAALGESCRHANCAAHDLIGWPSLLRRGASCPTPGLLGVIDTGVNPDHDLLDGAALDVLRLEGLAGDPSSAVHGTAVVSVLAGQPGSRIEGLLPEVPVLAVDAFSRAPGDERADTVALLRALDLMAGRGVRVVNLSLSGPPNAALGALIDRLAGAGMVLVAAVGNGGPQAEPVFPAAHPAVIGVTAVDARGRIYRQAQRGDHVDLAAPGVGLLLATSIRGAREVSGTSFAAPFVSAAAALVLAGDPALDVAGVRNRLAALARDMGAPGPDPVFGAGLLDAAGLCGISAASRP